MSTPRLRPELTPDFMDAMPPEFRALMMAPRGSVVDDIEPDSGTFGDRFGDDPALDAAMADDGVEP